MKNKPMDEEKAKRAFIALHLRIKELRVDQKIIYRYLFIVGLILGLILGIMI